jgi:D-serine deaminase-like pyridoxal phosphate-dependent protein
MSPKINLESNRGVHNEYFSKLNALLKKDGPGHAVIVLDLDILDKNLGELKNTIGDLERFRVVVKSLPSINLIRYILEQTQTRKAMVFHRPFLNLIAEEFPEADVLLGKPFPVQAARTFYRELKETSRFDPTQNLQWLIDTHQRLLQYRQLAHNLDQKLRINIEIDVGFHRGGIPEPERLAALLETIRNDQTHLTFAGFMGYDPHVPKSGKVFIPTEKAHSKVLKRYGQFIELLKEKFPDLYDEATTFNGAGSPTYTHYQGENLLNDLCVGSALIKPTNFDLASLSGHTPAMFIATPVLKKMRGVRIPFLEFLTPIMPKLKRSWGTTIFIYGGYWKALPMSPDGLTTNSLYGRSTNQEMLIGPENTAVDVDDYVFFRPTQSESVMLQFGDLVITRGGEIVGKWPVFSQSV